MQLIGLARLGRDAELRYIANGTAVANVSMAYNYGQKKADGSRDTQWIDVAIWGKRAEALVDYLNKGQQVVVTLDDVHIEEFEGRNGPGHKLVGTVSSIEFAGSKPDNATQGKPAEQRSQQPHPAPSKKPSFDDMDDDIPF